MVTINGFRVDVAINEDHSFDSEVTAHPVERGADVTDHVRARPITVSLEGIVSNTPIGSVATIRNQSGILADPAAVGLPGQFGQVLASPTEEAFALMKAIRDAREPVTIETSLQVFQNMVLTGLSVPRDADTGDALRFRATFQQIELITNERTTVRVEVPRSAKKINRGNKPSPTAGEAGAPSVPTASAARGSALDAIRRGRLPDNLFDLF